MKKIVGLLVFIVSAASLSANAIEEPKCINVGTRSEGWALNGQFIRYDNCENKYLECINQGTRSEAFAVFEKTEIEFLAYDNCAIDQSRKPLCGAIGTRSEGWLIAEVLKYDTCADKTVECVLKGTRTEGWSAYKKTNSTFLIYANCSQ